MSDDLYVGYLAKAPNRIGRFARRTALLLVIGAALVGTCLALLQDRFDPGTFEFGVTREIEGWVLERPYPTLLAGTLVGSGVGGDDTRSSGPRTYLLVAFGKHGAADAVAGLDGARVRVRGSLIEREGESMIELGGTPSDAPIERIESGGVDSTPVPSSRREDLGTMTLRGEIVDSKCFLGVMKPGRGKPHRACAVRCISGGIPPILRVETESGEHRGFLLTDALENPVRDSILDFVAEPVEISGRVFRQADQLFLVVDPSAIQRLD